MKLLIKPSRGQQRDESGTVINNDRIYIDTAKISDDEMDSGRTHRLNPAFLNEIEWQQ